MIIVSGRIYPREGARETFLDGSREAMASACRAAGCRDFVVAADPLEADRVNVYEERDDEHALLVFRGEAPSGDMTSLIPRAAVRRHEIASSAPP